MLSGPARAIEGREVSGWARKAAGGWAPAAPHCPRSGTAPRGFVHPGAGGGVEGGRRGLAGGGAGWSCSRPCSGTGWVRTLVAARTRRARAPRPRAPRRAPPPSLGARLGEGEGEGAGEGAGAVQAARPGGGGKLARRPPAWPGPRPALPSGSLTALGAPRGRRGGGGGGRRALGAKGREGSLSGPPSPIDMLIPFWCHNKEHLCTFKRLLCPGYRSLLSTN